MAKIIENILGRKTIKISTDDIISIVREYQTLTYKAKSYEEIRQILSDNNFYLPEDN